jgi:hypothetical protein
MGRSVKKSEVVEVAHGHGDQFDRLTEERCDLGDRPRPVAGAPDRGSAGVERVIVPLWLVVEDEAIRDVDCADAGQANTWMRGRCHDVLPD